MPSLTACRNTSDIAGGLLLRARLAHHPWQSKVCRSSWRKHPCFCCGRHAPSGEPPCDICPYVMEELPVRSSPSYYNLSAMATDLSEIPLCSGALFRREAMEGEEVFTRARKRQPMQSHGRRARRARAERVSSENSRHGGY